MLYRYWGQEKQPFELDDAVAYKWTFRIFHVELASLRRICERLVEAGFSFGLVKWNRDPEYEVKGWVATVFRIAQLTPDAWYQLDRKMISWIRDNGSTAFPDYQAREVDKFPEARLLDCGQCGDVIEKGPDDLPKILPKNDNWQDRWTRQVAREEQRLNQPRPQVAMPVLDAYLANRQRDASPVWSGWLHFLDFSLQGKIVCVTAMQPGPVADGLLIALAPGVYRSELRFYSQGQDTRVAGVRVFLGTETPATGTLLGTVPVAMATLGFYDHTRLLRAFQHDDDRLFAWGDHERKQDYDPIRDLGMPPKRYGALIHDLKKQLILPYVSTGCGDGTYPVHELVADGRRCGFAIVFIDPDL